MRWKEGACALEMREGARIEEGKRMFDLELERSCREGEGKSVGGVIRRKMETCIMNEDTCRVREAGG